MEGISTNLSELNDLFFELKLTNFKPILEETATAVTSAVTSTAELVRDEKFDLLVARLDDYLKSTPVKDDLFIKYLCMKASVFYEKAKTLSVQLEGTKDMLEKAVEIIEDQSDNSQVAYLYLRLKNYLGYLLISNGEYEKAKELLEKIMEKYDKTETVFIYSTEDLFYGAKMMEDQAKFNRLMVNNLQLLGWVYGRLGQTELQADKLHAALERQLNIDISDPISWAYSCMKLAAMYLSQEKFHQARYHLKACAVILDRLEKAFIEHPDLPQATAELALEWVTYGLQLFSTSRTRLLERKYPDLFKKPNETEIAIQEHLFTPFSNLPVDVTLIPVNFVTTCEEAKNLFVYTQSWLKRARLFYTLREYPVHYVNIVLDLTELYRYTAFYESDLDMQYTTHRKINDTLETLCSILKQVRPQCYVNVSVELLRELTEVQIDMMAINLQRIQLASSEQSEDVLRRQITAVRDIKGKLINVSDILSNQHEMYSSE